VVAKTSSAQEAVNHPRVAAERLHLTFHPLALFTLARTAINTQAQYDGIPLCLMSANAGKIFALITLGTESISDAPSALLRIRERPGSDSL
jgi:hypothetical protein